MDPQQLQQHSGIMAGLGAGFLFASLLVTAFFIFCLWRIFTKAGMSGAMSLIAIVPFVGPIIVLCILAFSKWNVVPVGSGYAAGQPYPPAYPTNYPPSGPASGL